MHLAFRIVELEGEQALELRIPILLDDEDSLVLLEESLHLLRERERANAAVVDLDSVPRQAIDCLVDCGITTADGDDSPLGGLARAAHDGFGDEPFRGLPFLQQAIHDLPVLDGVLRVAAVLVMPGAADEISAP